MTPEEARQAFAAAIDRPDEAIDLARAAKAHAGVSPGLNTASE